MGDEPSNGSKLGLPDVVELLRGDNAAAELRSGRALDALEHRVMAAISDIRDDLIDYRQAHGSEHVAQRTSSEVAHQRFDAYMNAAQIDAARKDGALGVMRLIIDTVGRNWKAIVAIAGAILAASGNVRISIGV